MIPQECENRLREAEAFFRNLHNPEPRHEIEKINGWSIRSNHWDQPAYATTLGQGGFHIQLWHEEKRISVLTPSAMTASHFEILIGCGCRHRVGCMQGVELFLKVCQNVELPDQSLWGCYALAPSTSP